MRGDPWPGNTPAINRRRTLSRSPLNTERGVEHAACLKTVSEQKYLVKIRKSGVGCVTIIGASAMVFILLSI